MAKRVAQMGNTTAKLNEYIGLAKQLVVDIETWELRVLDGVTKGGHILATKASVKAVNDALTALSGKVVRFTIGTANKQGVDGLVAAPAAGDAGKFLRADNTWAVPQDNTKVPKTGDAGALTGFATAQTASAAVTINDGANKAIFVPNGLAVTVANGTAGKSWEAKAHIATADTTVTLGNQWKWVGKGEVKANSILVLSWCNNIGYACLQAAAE